jgi:hypothetical protein
MNGGQAGESPRTAELTAHRPPLVPAMRHSRARAGDGSTARGAPILSPVGRHLPGNFSPVSAPPRGKTNGQLI